MEARVNRHQVDNIREAILEESNNLGFHEINDFHHGDLVRVAF
jgi:hypothetical protein